MSKISRGELSVLMEDENATRDRGSLFFLATRRECKMNYTLFNISQLCPTTILSGLYIANGLSVSTANGVNNVVLQSS
jgi:hypothetical protein